MNNLLKNKKNLLIGLIVLVLIVVVGGIKGYQIYNKQQENVLIQEANKLNSMNIQKDEIDMEIKSKGKYAIIEKAMKDYINDTKQACVGLVDICTNSELDKVLSAENIKADGPEFTATKEKLNNFKTQVNDYVEKLNDLINEENINNAVNDKGLSQKYIDLYQKLMLDGNNKESLNKTKESLNSSAEQINKSIDKMNNILNFLTENKDSWEIKDGKIQFNNISKLTEYYKVVNGR